MRRFRFAPLMLALCLMAAAPAGAEAKHYEFDTSHTRITFFISHAGFSNMIGRFREYEGSFDFDRAHPEKSAVELTIYPKSVDTDHEGLNKHLQGKDFFNTAKYPEMRFVSRKVKMTGKNRARVLGDFTMLGVTKPLVLDVTFNKAGAHPVTRNDTAGFTVKAVIRRSDFGMNYGAPNLIGELVQLHAEVEGTDMIDRVSGTARERRRR